MAEAWRQEIVVYLEAEYGCRLECKESNERLGRADYRVPRKQLNFKDDGKP